MSVYKTSFALGAGYSSHQVEFAVGKVKELKRNGLFNLNKTFAPAKLFYFLFMGSMVTFLPFVPVYMQQLGLDSLQIGIVRTVQPVGTIIACPVWGSIADRFSIHRETVITGIAIGGLATFATYFTPPSTLSSTSSSSSALCNDTTAIPTDPPWSWNSTYVTFSVVMALSVLSILFLAHVTPTVDSNVMQLLKDFPVTNYGKQRLWGAVGWGSFSALTGLSMDTYIKYIPGGNRFLPAYVLFAILMFPAIIPICLMKFPPHTRPESISGGIWRLFRRMEVLMFFLVAAIGGLSLGVINTYQFLFLNELKAPGLVMGLTLTFTCLSEIPFMSLSGKIIKLSGEETVFIIALVCYAARFFLYAILENPWLILPIELLHGVCFGALFPAMASFANRVAPPGMSATVQNLMSAISMGVGRSVGCIVGGYIYNSYGARSLFWDCGYLCSGTSVVYIFYAAINLLLTRCRRNSQLAYDQI